MPVGWGVGGGGTDSGRSVSGSSHPQQPAFPPHLPLDAAPAQQGPFRPAPQGRCVRSDSAGIDGGALEKEAQKGWRTGRCKCESRSPSRKRYSAIQWEQKSNSHLSYPNPFLPTAERGASIRGSPEEEEEEEEEMRGLQTPLLFPLPSHPAASLSPSKEGVPWRCGL